MLIIPADFLCLTLAVMDSSWCSSGGAFYTGRRNSSSSAVRSAGDRFIPSRRNSDFEYGYFKVCEDNIMCEVYSKNK